MDTFPSIEPVYAIAKDSSPLGKKSKLGDGYHQSINFGLNLIKPEWSVRWLVSFEDASTIDLFFRQRSDDGESFYWTPPDASSILLWRCDEWTVEYLADSLVQIDATFRQVFELAIPELSAVATECLDDQLCVNDYYALELGNWDIWVARLDPNLGSTYNYASNVYVSDSGFIYLAYLYPSGGFPCIHVAKFQPSGNVIWVKRYSNCGIRADNGGNSKQLQLTELSGENRIAITWHASQYQQSFGAGLWGTSSGEILGLLCIDSRDGQVKWGNKMFSQSGAWQSYSATCSHHTGDFAQGASPEYVRWDTVTKVLVHHSRFKKLTAFDINGNYPTYQYGYSSVYHDGDSQFATTDAGYIGNQRYDRINGSNIFYNTMFAPTGGGTSINSSGYIPYSATANSSNGTRPVGGWFLGNGQALLYFSGVVGGYDEIMIIGSNFQIVDHVRLPGAYLQETTDWPWYNSFDGTSGNLAAWPAFRQAKLVANEETIYLHTQVQGAFSLELDVTMSGNSVLSINGLKRRSRINTNVDPTITNYMGATRYTSSNPVLKRIVTVAGKPRQSGALTEVGLIGMNRGLTTVGGATQTLSCGTRQSIAIRNNIQYSGNNTYVAAIRTGRQAPILQVNNLHNGAVSAIPLSQPCPPGGADIIAFELPTTAVDVTSTMTFSLYTSSF